MDKFKYGSLIIKCHQCGNEEIIEDLVTDGRAIYLFNHADSYLKLECKKCEITMEMLLKPSDNAPEEIPEVYEELSEEVVTEEVV